MDLSCRLEKFKRLRQFVARIDSDQSGIQSQQSRPRLRDATAQALRSRKLLVVLIEGEKKQRPKARRCLAWNKEQFKGSWQQFKGELKKRWGRQLTDNDLLERKATTTSF